MSGGLPAPSMMKSAFATAPPRLLAGSGFHDTLAVYSKWGWWGADASVPAGAAAVANQFASSSVPPTTTYSTYSPKF